MLGVVKRALADPNGVKDLKKLLPLIPVALFAILLGCGGGGGGGGGGGTNGTTTCNVVGFTAGQTGVLPGDTVLGQVVDTGGCTVPNVTVRFYNSANTLLTSAVTNADGYWRGPVSSTATKVDVDGTTLPNKVQKGFKYGLGVYQASTLTPSFTCRVALPALTFGVLTPMPSHAFIFQKFSDPPLPPPTGCQP